MNVWPSRCLPSQLTYEVVRISYILSEVIKTEYSTKLKVFQNQSFRGFLSLGSNTLNTCVTSVLVFLNLSFLCILRHFFLFKKIHTGAKTL